MFCKLILALLAFIIFTAGCASRTVEIAPQKSDNRDATQSVATQSNNAKLNLHPEPRGFIKTDAKFELEHDGVAQAEWLDYDNDGDQDLLLLGYFDTKLYRNDNGQLVDSKIKLPKFSIKYQNFAIADYDNDGDKDIAFTGRYSCYEEEIEKQTMNKHGDHIVNVYENLDGQFRAIKIDTPPNQMVRLAWGNIDDDPDLELKLDYWFQDNPYSQVIDYVDGNFVPSHKPNNGSNQFRYWVNRDTGGLTDVININGEPGWPHQKHPWPFENFIEYAWADFDNDGDLDVVGSQDRNVCMSMSTTLLINNEGVFRPRKTDIEDVRSSHAFAWGDYDNDGDMDILIAEDSYKRTVTKLYINTEGKLIDSGLDFIGVQHGAVAWGDYDNDGYLDIFIGGRLYGGVLYRNVPISQAPKTTHSRAIGKILWRKITFDFKSISLADALGEISKLVDYDIKFTIDTAEPPMIEQLKASNMSVDLVIGWLARTANLKLSIDNNTLHFTSTQ